jgi:hypothetical protein
MYLRVVDISAWPTIYDSLKRKYIAAVQYKVTAELVPKYVRAYSFLYTN